MNTFILFAFVASITPGPTNILILTNSSRHGFFAALPLICGASISAAFIVWIAGVGLATPLVAYPEIRKAMMVLGLIWLTWLAWKLFSSPVSTLTLTTEQPRQGAVTGAGLQFINPKTWMMAFAVISVYLPQLHITEWQSITRLAVIFGLIATVCLSAWAVAGSQSARWLTSSDRLRHFNQAMALLLLFSSWWAVLK